MSVAEHIKEFQIELEGTECQLVAVSKTKPGDMIKEAFEAGQRIFGENKAQEMTQKQEELPSEIRWHMIGHLQRNKVKYIVPYVDLIHSADSLRLIREIEKQAAKIDRKVNVLIQMHIAREESKYGLDENELEEVLNLADELPHVRVKGLMGMATFTDDQERIRDEFRFLAGIYKSHKEEQQWDTLSMGMTNDYKLALEEGSNMIRIGSAIFGERNYQ